MSELTYGSYLYVDELLKLQEPRSNPEEHDELLFIVVHQAYELWFKLMLHELERARDEFNVGQLWPAVSTFKRLRTIMKLLVEQVDIVETLTPMSFNSFRDRLDTASGFQSVQFREVEYFLGYKRPELIRFHPEGSPGRAKLQRRLDEPSVVDAFYRFLEHQGVAIPDAVRDRPRHAATEPSEPVQDQLLVLYKSRPDIEVLVEIMTDFDEGMQEWRYRHVKLVERTIGSKHGTGGSLGAEFLKKSLFRSAFPDLWAIRHKL